MTSARYWPWLPPPRPSGRSGGRLIILYLLAMLLISAGCWRSGIGTPRYVPTIPARPTLEYGPEMIPECTPAVKGVEQAPGQCVIIWRADWLAIGAWALTLEREARAMCLALGWTEKDCGVNE